MKRRAVPFTSLTSLSSWTNTVLLAGALSLASCAKEPKEQPTAAPTRVRSSSTTKPGVAGGVFEDVVISEAIVSAVDVPSRRVTLTGPGGDSVTFTASPEIKNLPQMHVGDKVTATFARRMYVSVRSDNAPPSIERSRLHETARPGEKPGMMAAKETEMVARIRAIDPVSRVADLEFADGVVERVPVRPDVDLSRYKVGDNAVIRVTSALTVLVRTP